MARLHSLRGVRRELARLYTEARRSELAVADASRLGNLLFMTARTLEIEREAGGIVTTGELAEATAQVVSVATRYVPAKDRPALAAAIRALAPGK